MSKTYHEMEDGSRLTITAFRKGVHPDLHGKQRRGVSYSNIARHLKDHMLDWADGLPEEFFRGQGVSQPAVRDVFKRIVWAQDMGQGHAAFSYDTLRAGTKKGKPYTPTTYSHSVAERAVRWLHSHGLIQIKTPRGWDIKGRRNLANQYRPNWWAFLASDDGTFTTPPYILSRYEWAENADAFRARVDGAPMPHRDVSVARDTTGSRGDNSNSGPTPHRDVSVKGKNRQNSAEASRHGDVLYTNTGGAHTAPTSTRACGQ